ncbi:MAG: ComEA family DNA-binding protein [Actinomycetota bacterium]
MLVAALVGAASLWYERSLPRAVEVRPLAAPSPIVEPTAVASPVFVHVVGRVREPGVYELAAGDRLIDAIAAAGGARGDADLEALNLAAPVADGTQVVVPRRGESTAPATVGGAPAGVDASGKVNINTASLAELETLPRVGEVLAQRIIDHRTANGPFASIEGLLDVSGIGDATFEGLRDLVTV